MLGEEEENVCHEQAFSAEELLRAPGISLRASSSPEQGKKFKIKVVEPNTIFYACFLFQWFCDLTALK